MSLQFIIGSSGSGKSCYAYQNIIEQAGLNPEKLFFVIVPEQFTMQTQKTLVEMSPGKGILNIDILSFERLAYRVLEEVGGDSRTLLEETGKSMVLQKMVQQHGKELSYLGGQMRKAGYLDEVKSILSEFMQYDIRDSEIQEMIEDSKLMDLRKQPAAFMTSYHRTRELFGAALYGGAIKAASTVQFKGKTFDITTADGQPLFSTAHPAKVSGPAQCNLFKDAFSVDALGQMETAMQIFCGDTEEILDVSPDTILIPDLASLKKDVFAAIGADKDPATANNAFNYQFGRWTVICWPYLNKFITAGTAPWILLDSKYNEQYGGAVWNDRIPLAVRSTIDENTDANVWRGRSRWNATFNDWRFAAIGGISTGEDLPD